MITFRVIQGAGAALMFPAALAIVVGSFAIAERGKALAAFFGITGALTAVGPLAGGYLTEISWRTIFWVNIPVAIIALILTAKANPDEHEAPGADRLPRPRPDRRRHGPRDPRPAAGRQLGLGRSRRRSAASPSAWR